MKGRNPGPIWLRGRKPREGGPKALARKPTLVAWGVLPIRRPALSVILSLVVGRVPSELGDAISEEQRGVSIGEQNSHLRVRLSVVVPVLSGS